MVLTDGTNFFANSRRDGDKSVMSGIAPAALAARRVTRPVVFVKVVRLQIFTTYRLDQLLR